MEPQRKSGEVRGKAKEWTCYEWKRFAQEMRCGDMRGSA